MVFLLKQKFFLLVILTSLIILLISLPIAKSSDLESKLPPLKAHILPTTLENWQYETKIGDYFPQIDSHLVGYFIYSEFPIKVFVDSPNLPFNPENFSQRRFHKWVESVRLAIAEWNNYLPIEEVKIETEADIIIKRQYPPLKTKINSETGLYESLRAKSAQTRYKFYVKKNSNQSILAHQMTIDINPDQTDSYILAAARHELGHALGIWGHSEEETDIMYFSQVQNSPPISARDINTLKLIYSQPTRLGWELE